MESFHVKLIAQKALKKGTQDYQGTQIGALEGGREEREKAQEGK
jgi:hypothetical protein